MRGRAAGEIRRYRHAAEGSAADQAEGVLGDGGGGGAAGAMGEAEADLCGRRVGQAEDDGDERGEAERVWEGGLCGVILCDFDRAK